MLLLEKHFFPFRVEPHGEEDKNENGRVASLESVPIHLNT